MMPTCQELARHVASDRTVKLGWFDRLRYRIHGWMCPPCRHYAQQIESIGEVVRSTSSENQPAQQEMQNMQSRCLEKLKARAAQAARESDGVNGRDID